MIIKIAQRFKAGKILSIVASFGMVAVGQIALANDLNTPVGDLNLSSYTWWNVQVAKPGITSASPLVDLLGEDFMRNFKALNRPEDYARPEDPETIELRRHLAERGLPANLSPAELNLLKKFPQNIYFKRLKDIEFAGKFHGGGNFAARAEQNGLFFVIDFLKAYAQERQRKPSYRFADYINISRVNADQAAGVIAEAYPVCAGLIDPLSPK